MGDLPRSVSAALNPRYPKYYSIYNCVPHISSRPASIFSVVDASEAGWETQAPQIILDSMEKKERLQHVWGKTGACIRRNFYIRNHASTSCRSTNMGYLRRYCKQDEITRVQDQQGGRKLRNSQVIAWIQKYSFRVLGVCPNGFFLSSLLANGF